ncbi:hypothetical protein IGI04_035524 [Brassica rapa subsp. trilocularis]|uniref:Secreted protein n=1 Tax=Brassica rapa subsp. trilocularis TaxID=1813537 RepID=A0ABQ7LBX8_BRACM|nr:hypothetical protein IGI04_035524 [Brassica rapa subsp. trilocularis]
MSRLHFAFIVLIRCWSVPWSDLRCLGALSYDPFTRGISILVEHRRVTYRGHSQPERPAQVTRVLTRGFLVICFDSIHNASSELATQKLINRHFPPKRLSEYFHSESFDIPQNWFDNHLYYNICLRSLENS